MATHSFTAFLSEKTNAHSGGTPSRIYVIFFFFFTPAEQHNWRQRDQSEPWEDNHTLTEEITIAERDGHVLWTQMSHFARPPTVRSCASVLIALLWSLRLMMMRNLIQTSRERSQVVWVGASDGLNQTAAFKGILMVLCSLSGMWTHLRNCCTIYSYNVTCFAMELSVEGQQYLTFTAGHFHSCSFWGGAWRVSTVLTDGLLMIHSSRKPPGRYVDGKA